MSIEYRFAEPAEYAAAIDTMSGAFLERPDVARVAEAIGRFWEPGQVLAAFDGPLVCGTFRTWTTDLTVPGLAQVRAAAVSGVAVRPTHRRRGILTGMAARAHAAHRERGDAVALLYASEYPIYGRFGYAPGTRIATWAIDARAAVMRGGPAAGVELVTPDAASADVVKGVFDAWWVRQPGEIRRRDVTWPFRLGLEEEPWGETWKGFLAIRRDASGMADGYARYKAKQDWAAGMPRATVEVQELVALTDEAYSALWRFLLELDLVTSVTMDGGSEHERLPWLLVNARAARATEVHDGLWVRLFDVPRALAARTYERAGTVVLEVVDDDAFGGRQRLLLDAGPEGATCRPTDRPADLTLPVAALGAAYLGGTRLRDVSLATGADEHRAGAMLTADAMLRTSGEPVCSTFF